MKQKYYFWIFCFFGGLFLLLSLSFCSLLFFFFIPFMSAGGDGRPHPCCVPGGFISHAEQSPNQITALRGLIKGELPTSAFSLPRSVRSPFGPARFAACGRFWSRGGGASAARAARGGAQSAGGNGRRGLSRAGRCGMAVPFVEDWDLVQTLGEGAYGE